MREYRVSYYLGDMYHSYLVDADNEFEATEKALRGVVSTSMGIFTGLKVERYFREWN